MRYDFTKGWGRYVLAVLVTVAALLITVPLTPVARQTPAAFGAVLLSAWLGGLAPGLLTTALSVPIVGYLLIGTAGGVRPLPQLLSIVVFIVVSAVIPR